MEHSKLANENRRGAQIGRSASPQPDQTSTARSAGNKAARKKAAPKKAKRALPLRKKIDRESKSNRLVCRYCGSEDLASSFIERRDRRCRKCFSKRYGSAARAKGTLKSKVPAQTQRPASKRVRSLFLFSQVPMHLNEGYSKFESNFLRHLVCPPTYRSYK